MQLAYRVLFFQFESIGSHTKKYHLIKLLIDDYESLKDLIINDIDDQLYAKIVINYLLMIGELEEELTNNMIVN